MPARRDVWDSVQAYQVKPESTPADAVADAGFGNLGTLFADQPAFVRRVALAMAFEPPLALQRGRRPKPVGP